MFKQFYDQQWSIFHIFIVLNLFKIFNSSWVWARKESDRKRKHKIKLARKPDTKTRLLVAAAAGSVNAGFIAVNIMAMILLAQPALIGLNWDPFQLLLTFRDAS